jgi:succinoglycan biosynthesis transport protein ExoP
MAREGSDFSGSEVAYPPAAEGSPSRAIAPVATNYPLAAPGFGGTPPRGPEILHSGFNQTWLANCLRRRWLMAVAMGLLMGAGVAGLLMYLFPETHQITAYLKVKSTTENNLFDDNRSKPSPQDIERQAMNHLALLKSQMVLEAALARQEIADLDAVRAHRGEELLWLTSELRVTFPGDGEILEVRYEGQEDPEQMKKIIDAVVQAYKDKVLLQDRLVVASTRTDLQAVFASTQEQLQKKMNDLKEEMRTKNRLDPEVEVPRLRAEITRLENLISETSKDLVNIEIFKRLALENARSPAAVNAMVASAVDKDPMIGGYQNDIYNLQKAVQQRQAGTRNANDSQLKRLQRSLEQTQMMLQQHRAAVEKSARAEIEKMPNEALRQAIIEHRIRYESATADLQKHQQDLEEATQRLIDLGIRDPELEMLEGDIETEREISKNLQQKIYEWQVEQQARDRDDIEGRDSDFDKVVVMQKAAALPATNKIERYSIAGIGGLAALALTCYGVALMEFRHRRLNGPTDMDEGLGIRVLGVLPSTSLKQLAGNSLVATQVAEAIDNVRATLMHDSTSTPRQVIMVTSSQTQGGNTVVAASLALSLSRAGRRTLLIDGDLRAPSLHKLFGMALEDGFSEVLRAEIDLADAVRPTNNEGLYLLTAGVCNAEAIHLLATDQPHAIFEKLRDQFDFIVIDAPPVLGISDALSMGQYIDGAVLTVLRDHSQIRKVHKSVETLRSMGIRVVGAVVNGVPLKADRRVVRLHQARVQQPPRLPAKAES